jgi:hypothetical protein
MDLTLGNYSTTIGFPLLEATDTPSGTNGVHESSDPEVFVIVDEVPIGTTLTIKDAEGSTLLSEPLKELTLPPTLEQIQASNEENTSSAAAGAGVLLGGFILLLIMGIGCIVVLIVVIVIAYFVFFKKKTNLSAPSQKKKFR